MITFNWSNNMTFSPYKLSAALMLSSMIISTSLITDASACVVVAENTTIESNLSLRAALGVSGYKKGLGEWKIVSSNTNTFYGAMEVQEGTLTLSAANALGSGGQGNKIVLKNGTILSTGAPAGNAADKPLIVPQAISFVDSCTMRINGFTQLNNAITSTSENQSNAKLSATGAGSLSFGQSFSFAQYQGIFDIAALKVSIKNGSFATTLAKLSLNGTTITNDSGGNLELDANLFVAKSIQIDPKGYTITIRNAEMSRLTMISNVGKRSGKIICKMAIGGIRPGANVTTKQQQNQDNYDGFDIPNGSFIQKDLTYVPEPPPSIENQNQSQITQTVNAYLSTATTNQSSAVSLPTTTTPIQLTSTSNFNGIVEIPGNNIIQIFSSSSLGDGSQTNIVVLKENVTVQMSSPDGFVTVPQQFVVNQSAVIDTNKKNVELGNLYGNGTVSVIGNGSMTTSQNTDFAGTLSVLSNTNVIVPSNASYPATTMSLTQNNNPDSTLGGITLSNSIPNPTAGDSIVSISKIQCD